MPKLPHPEAASLRRDPLPLRGRTALVTGASRRGGIGYAVARRLAAHGASVYLHHHVPHDEAKPWGADPEGPEAVAAGVRAALGDPSARVCHGPGDLSTAAAPAELIATATRALGGRLDILVANHALSGFDGTLLEIDAEKLDAHWAIDTRAVLLLIQTFARQRAALPARTPGGRVVMMTSGQDIAGGMPGELAYALAKGALASVTRSLSTTLAELAVTVNTVNPGPVDTDYMEGEEYQAVADLFPAGRWGMPDDPARLIAWLATDEAEWITGQVIDSEGGFRR
ncbi:SDR family oxidoreductase [Streptomyces clavuligerus]|uniref:3-ketoacyl reductase n=1 Tax=Streptomyces clavuligerus TaxID=1901 RepID=E2Q9K8_STRCL|nr:SDR family oxidoreductase [Streptomyces clavuligerus]ANW21255.1 3-ketoacyl-ACP reductase [Streptomyces clavuligerus]AXU15881.1 SDR family oxidoreductase [Streptomyces clavuligerus]EFG05628.1 3-ketoacyl reductase [Streptomyces clavuligerus]MBY6306006.1 SDR family oxidoreductase [Streptomyces clavuligerus]QCS08663.1 3-ketoacyl-ACP reductase [Streptomyces clavuligerus]